MKKILIFIMVNILMSATIVASISDVDKESQEALCNDVIITALTPTINEALDSYYKNIFKETPIFSVPYWVKVTKIDRPNGDHTQYFIIEVEVLPYVAAHMVVGKDRVTIELKYPGTQKILKYEHLEDYELPKYLEHYYI